MLTKGSLTAVNHAHLHRGFNEAQTHLLGEIMNLLLMIHLQLLHQLEGVHVSGTGAIFFYYCKIGRHHDLDPKTVYVTIKAHIVYQQRSNVFCNLDCQARSTRLSVL